MAIIECIPNVSEGRDPVKIEALAEAIRSVPDVKLLHIDPGYAANRTVFTFIGDPESVVEAAFQLYKKSLEVIDMTQHHGTHPRQGAIDVCPLVPLDGIDMNQCINRASLLAFRVSEELGISGYFYGKNAMWPDRVNLAFVRKGQYEALPGKLETLPPDFGTAENWERSGLTVIGCRNLLVAYNVNLNTKEVSVAKQIAENVRESGKVVKESSGSQTRVAGRLKSVRGLGWYIDEYQKAQVSYNLTDLDQAGMLDVYLATAEEAEKLGFEVTGSELVGLAPLSEFKKAGIHFKPGANSESELVNAAIAGLGLDELRPFNKQDKILEYLIGDQS